MSVRSPHCLFRWVLALAILAGGAATAADGIATSGWESTETTEAEATAETNVTDSGAHSLGGGPVFQQSVRGPMDSGQAGMRNTSAGSAATQQSAGQQSSVQSANANSMSIPANPAAVNIIVGSGAFGDAIGFNRNGLRFGGVTVNNGSGILSGGLAPGKWAGQQLTIGDLSFDTDKGGMWEGGLFGTEYLYHAGYGAPTVVNGIPQHPGSPNSLAGSALGFNSLDNRSPTDRSELYQLWYRHEFFDKKLVVRIGKSVPTYDFGNVVKPKPTLNGAGDIPGVSGAILTPLYVNPTMLGLIPGYYNSAAGVVAALNVSDDFYLQYGFFDGSLALQKQTGLEGPHFNGHYFHIGEVGTSWTLTEDDLPGRFGVGYWGQTGYIPTFNGPVNGAQGVYFFGSQCLYWENPGKSNQGLNGFYQFGASDSPFVITQRFFGCGLTYFGLLPNRDDDSFGFAMAWGRQNSDPNIGRAFYTGYGTNPAPLGTHEVILTWYYQIKVADNIFVQPNLTYIPDPARVPGTPGAFPFTLQATMLF
jgi:porin